ncbi:MAG: alpha-glucosidase C-terminal domain-containing protein, partial [Bacillota bacterium]
GDDPDNRRCMPWNNNEKADYQLKEFYNQIIKIRRKSKILQKGKFEKLFLDEAKNIYAFKRIYKGEKIIIILNNNSLNRKVNFNSAKNEYIDLITKSKYKTTDSNFNIEMAPYQALILK